MLYDKNCCEINILKKFLALNVTLYDWITIQINLIKIPYKNLFVDIQISSFMYYEFNSWILILIIGYFKLYFNKKNDI